MKASLRGAKRKRAVEACSLQLEEVTTDLEVPAAGGGIGGASARDRLSILVLDDDPSRHEAFAQAGRGHRIDHAWLVDEAIARLRLRRYDLVCLDNDLLTEPRRREGFEVASIIAGMPSGEQPKAVLIHSWNEPRAREMERVLRPFYLPGVTLVRAEFGSFALRGPSPACAGAPDLRRWIARAEPLEASPLEGLLTEVPR